MKTKRGNYDFLTTSVDDAFRKLLSATVRKGAAGKFFWIGSDSWGAKIHPVRDQEWAAEGAITILPKRANIRGKLISEVSQVIFFIFFAGFDDYFQKLRPSKGEECSKAERNDKMVKTKQFELP